MDRCLCNHKHPCLWNKCLGEQLPGGVVIRVLLSEGLVDIPEWLGNTRCHQGHLEEKAAFFHAGPWRRGAGHVLVVAPWSALPGGELCPQLSSRQQGPCTPGRGPSDCWEPPGGILKAAVMFSTEQASEMQTSGICRKESIPRVLEKRVLNACCCMCFLGLGSSSGT